MAKEHPKKRAKRYWSGGKYGKRRCDDYPFSIGQFIEPAWIAGFRAGQRGRLDREVLKGRPS